MISKYICNWINQIFVLWFIFGYLLNIKWILKYINLSYLVVFQIFAQLFIYIYLIIKNKFIFDEDKDNYSYMIINIIIHILPLIILINIKKFNTKYALENMIILILLYYLYMNYINKSIYELYFADEIVQSWNKMKEICKKNKDSKNLNCLVVNHF